MSHENASIKIEVPNTAGIVYGQPRIWLGLEAAAMLTISVLAYRAYGYSWISFAVIFLLPDLTFLGYLAGSRFGSTCYNIAHTYVLPVVIGVALHLTGGSLAIPLIWIAHIGFDRTVGYGLKYPTGFGFTHLGIMGRQEPAAKPTDYTV